LILLNVNKVKRHILTFDRRKMIEKRIYSPWAFTKDEAEKCEMNRSIYNEIKNKAIVLYTSQLSEMNEVELENLKKEKTIILDCGSGYATHKYMILSNSNNLSTLEIALIADEGNLCFGYRLEGSFIIVHTD